MVNLIVEVQALYLSNTGINYLYCAIDSWPSIWMVYEV